MLNGQWLKMSDMSNRVSTWVTCKLGECVKLLSGGTPSKSNPNYWGGNIPWVSCKDMKTSYLYDSQDYLTEDGIANGTCLVPPETILIVVRGMILAKHFPVAITKRSMAFNQDLKALECAPNLEPKFLFYWFQGKSYEILGIADEAAHGTKRLQTDRLQNLPLHLPPIQIQRRIIAILSAYDDLIENNKRRIEILEEMARSLYREWFVNFRFPGHEQVKMVDSELGLIPEEWEVVTLQDITNYINRGISPKYDDNSISIVINQKCIRDSRLNLELARKHSKNVPPDKLVRFGDVLVNSTGVGTLGRVAQVYHDIHNCSIDSHVSIVRPNKKVNIDYFGFTLFKLEPHFSDLGVGATGQTELRRQSLSETVVLIPPEHFQRKFSGIVAPMRQLCLKLSTKNGFLRQTRDILLPKLISGEIDVENLDITSREIAA
jgi:type I restriction enzyme S subunit